MLDSLASGQSSEGFYEHHGALEKKEVTQYKLDDQIAAKVNLEDYYITKSAL